MELTWVLVEINWENGKTLKKIRKVLALSFTNITPLALRFELGEYCFETILRAVTLV